MDKTYRRWRIHVPLTLPLPCRCGKHIAVTDRNDNPRAWQNRTAFMPEHPAPGNPCHLSEQTIFSTNIFFPAFIRTKYTPPVGGFQPKFPAIAPLQAARHLPSTVRIWITSGRIALPSRYIPLTVEYRSG